jgi:hypothetical protein
MSLERFTQSCITAALGSSLDDDGNPLYSNYDESDITPETLAQMKADCRTFYDANKAHIHCDGAPMAEFWDGSSESERQAAMAGHDFWLTRCGHGAGFWDGDWPEPAASALDAASEKAGNIDLYIGDDGLIYA